MFGTLYNEILYRPLLNLLVFFYNIFGDFGIAIIAVTVIVRLILYPIAKQSLVHQKKLKQIQPKLKELQEKHKNDKEKLTQEMMALYKEHNFNPASGCLPMIVQIIIFIALYRVLIAGLGSLDQGQLYGFIPHPGKIDTGFLDLFDLGQKSANVNFSELIKLNLGKGIEILNAGGVVLALVAGAAQFFQTKHMMKMTEKKKQEARPTGSSGQAGNGKREAESPDMAGEMAEMMQKQMLYFFPLLTVFIGLTFPAGLALYWVTSTLLMIGQQHMLNRNEK
ncbi:MAG: YidC/Oxa1 family membrane protein insertase [Candidatus Moranbacteria bacterium]|nr:YidC/Oxa1 family membrane protein insertase [Candidatus Moranbacteria bacterium]